MCEDCCKACQTFSSPQLSFRTSTDQGGQRGSEKLMKSNAAIRAATTIAGHEPGKLTWDGLDLKRGCILRVEMLQAGVNDVRPAEAANPSVYCLPLCLNHLRQSRVWQLLVQNTLHERSAIVVFDVPHPLQHKRQPSDTGQMKPAPTAGTHIMFQLRPNMQPLETCICTFTHTHLVVNSLWKSMAFPRGSLWIVQKSSSSHMSARLRLDDSEKW